MVKLTRSDRLEQTDSVDMIYDTYLHEIVSFAYLAKETCMGHGAAPCDVIYFIPDPAYVVDFHTDKSG